MIQLITNIDTNLKKRKETQTWMRDDGWWYIVMDDKNKYLNPEIQHKT